MAAPKETTLEKLGGKFTMNKKLSDDPDSLLKLQGVSWFIRKAISFATITLTVTEYEEDSNTHIDILQVATGGISSTTEKRILDWTSRSHSDNIFGTVHGKSRWVKGLDVDMQGGGGDEDLKFLKAEVLKGGEKEGAFLEDGSEAKRHVQSWVESEGGGWNAEQIWGFEKVDGNRYYTRRVIVRKDDTSESERARLIYDYHG